MVRRKTNTSITRSTSGNKSQTNVLVHRRPPPYHRALKEIKYLRRSVQLIIPKAPFTRLVREIILELFPTYGNMRIQLRALEALQEATEAYITQFFEDSLLLSIHAKRVTLMRHDMVLMRRLRGRDDIINK